MGELRPEPDLPPGEEDHVVRALNPLDGIDLHESEFANEVQ